jgi:hypothetical protein
LEISATEGNKILIEALLRRGFLAVQDGVRIYLAEGSHWADTAILNKAVEGLTCTQVSKSGKALVTIDPRHQTRLRDIAFAIVDIPDHPGGMTTANLATYVKPTWKEYKEMVWGAKLAVVPPYMWGNFGAGTLDTGIALLVKALPLARVGTRLSCDGHCIRPASVDFFFDWDVVWLLAVFNLLRFSPRASAWSWTVPLGRWGIGRLEIKSLREGDVIGMLSDIQFLPAC